MECANVSIFPQKNNKMSYKELFHRAPVPLVVSNNKGIIELMNERAMMFFGKKDNSMVGNNIMRSIDSLHCSFTDFHKDLLVKSNYLITLDNGSKINAQISSTVISSEEENKYIFSFHPLTTNEQLAHDLKEVK